MNNEHEFKLEVKENHDEVYTCAKCGHVVVIKHSMTSSGFLNGNAMEGCKTEVEKPI